MQLHEKINYLLQEKEISKKEFVERVLELEPRLLSTGEVPSERTMYRYLDASRDIKVELIPYFAEVLNVSIEVLFYSEIEYSSDYNTRYSKEAREILDLLTYTPRNIVQMILTTMRKYKELHDNNEEAYTRSFKDL